MKRRVTVYRLTGYKRVFENVTKCKRDLKVTTIEQTFIQRGKSKVKS